MGRKSPLKVRRYVDMWALPGAHPTNIELLQQLKTADSQHFTRGMDVVGTVKEQDQETGRWSRSHLIGVRTDVWKPSKAERAKSLKVLKKKRHLDLKQQIKRSGRLSDKQEARLAEQVENDSVMKMSADDVVSRRLVLKLFRATANRVRWVGTIEEVTTTEVHNSIGSRKSLISTVAMLPRSDMVVRVQQNHRTFRLPAIFTFGYFHNNRMWNMTLKQRWFSFGVDFDVEADCQRIGKLDGVLIACGSDSYVNLHDHALSGDTQFADLLTLFTSTVGYHRAMRRSIRRRVKAARRGEWHRHQIEDEELRLKHNGRAAA